MRNTAVDQWALKQWVVTYKWVMTQFGCGLRGKHYPEVIRHSGPCRTPECLVTWATLSTAAVTLCPGNALWPCILNRLINYEVLSFGFMQASSTTELPLYTQIFPLRARIVRRFYFWTYNPTLIKLWCFDVVSLARTTDKQTSLFMAFDQQMAWNTLHPAT